MYQEPTKCIYVRKTNKMHVYLLIYSLNYPLHVSNKQFHHQEVISVHAACSISHASVGCLAANAIRLELFLAYRVSG